MKKHEDYYTLLGVAKNASQEEIQKAYRKLARRYHPDMNSDSGAEEKFKQLNEAHSTLIHPEHRKLYDRYGSQWREAQAYHEQSPHTGANNTYWHDYSSDFHSGVGGERFQDQGIHDFFSGLFGNTNKSQRYGEPIFQEKGGNVEAELEVSLHELASGVTKTISWTSYDTRQGDARSQLEQVQVKIPRGLKNGSVIRLAGKGQKAYGQNGDLLLHVRVTPDSRFTLKEYDVYTTVSISPWEAALGAKVEVETISGKIQLTVPKGCSSGRKLRVNDKGLPMKNGKKGDFYVVIQIHVPQHLSAKEQQLFKELKEISSFNPRHHSSQKSA